MFKRWIPASFIAVAIALALAGGAVLAVGGTGDERRSDIFARAAEILGIDQSQLEGAHEQATRDIRNEQLANIVEKLVAEGLLEQGEADSFLAWMADRPDSADALLVASLVPSPVRLHVSPPSRLGLHRLGLQPGSELIERMAGILGIEGQELANALADGAKDADEASTDDPEDRLALMHALVDDLQDAGSITADDATRLHSWVDDTPQWLLDADLPARVLSVLGFAPDAFMKPGGLRGFDFGFPFGDHFGEGDLNFEFEFRGPEGSFRFGPGEHNRVPEDGLFGNGELRGLMERFGLERFLGPEGLEGLEGSRGFERFDGLEGLKGLGSLQDLFDRFEELEGLGGFERFEGPDGFNGFRFFSPPYIEPEDTGDSAESTDTAA